MKLYEASRKYVQSQLDTILAWQATHDPFFDPESSENREHLELDVTREAMSMAIGILVRLDVIDNPDNDQAQASVRELIRILSSRLDVDVEDLGVPL